MQGSEYPARWWHVLEDGRIQCDLCPRDCKLHEGQRGMCFVRQRTGDQLVLTTYGRSSGFCVDPIEKKPLAHFHPGSQAAGHPGHAAPGEGGRARGGAAVRVHGQRARPHGRDDAVPGLR